MIADLMDSPVVGICLAVALVIVSTVAVWLDLRDRTCARTYENRPTIRLVSPPFDWEQECPTLRD